MIVKYVKKLVKSNGLKWQRPLEYTATSAKFINGNKIIQFEKLDNQEIDCYYEESESEWRYTNKETKFAGLWKRFIE